MTARSAAKRYALALYDVVSKSGDIERASRDLEAIVGLLRTNEELRRVLTTPAVPPAKKRAVLLAVLQAAGGLSPQVTRTLLLLAERDRLGLVGEVRDAFADRVREADRVVPGEVVTAVPLSDNQRTALEAAIGRASGRGVALSAKVDPAIMGGVVARVGTVVFDGSVARQLERLKQRLAES